MKTPQPPDCRRDRKQLDTLRVKLKEIRRRYVALCWKRITATRRNGKIRRGLVLKCIAEMAAKMKVRGLYSLNTNDGDVRYLILRQFRRIDPTAPKRAHQPFAWADWLDANGVKIEHLRAA